ncbi:MAG: type II CRISPR-associated endonuclease Cas1 [Candidatus Symbiothrix sp.]|jgi:CRISPR-associated protein Cas1|nr:type II CRISPR-associated endonuclease Cas1 [Candidatus Symbiothrix sp.]
MIKKTLYFENPAYLSLKNQQLVMKLPEVEKNDSLPESFKADSLKTIPIEDIGVVILDNKQITITHGLIEALLANNCAVITCGSNRMPVGLQLPLDGNTLQRERFQAQIEASVPLKKQLWQQTIQAKITNQAAVLEFRNVENKKCRNDTGYIETGNMRAWVGQVKSGDSDNLEARAAAYYWKNLFPDVADFTRGREGVPPNNLLNYGYAILRALVARALVASGLLPTFGIHHHNRYNAYCLADDIMEPYRPFVDKLVVEVFNVEIKKCRNVEIELTKDIKVKLLQIPVLDVVINEQRSPLMIAVGQTTASLAKCYLGESRKIAYPQF